MDYLNDVTGEDLRDRLDEVESKEASQRVMVAIAYKQGVSIPDLAEWYGIEPGTLEEWFEEFDSSSVVDVISDIERFEFPGRSVKPVVRQPGVARVTFLNYEAMGEFGWSLEDDDLFEKAAAAELDHRDYGRVAVERGESILEAVERRGYEWPYACRGDACSNCAVLLWEGQIAMPGQQILSEDAIERGARLTCVGVPASETVKFVYNAKEVDFLDELRLPPDRFEHPA